MQITLAKGLSFDFKDPRVLGDGFRAWIGGEPGSGKSTAAASIACQVLEQRGQLIMLDAHGEYSALATVADNVALVGYATRNSLTLANEPGAIEGYLKMIDNGHSVIFNLQEWVDIEPATLDAFVFPLIRGIYKIRMRKPRLTMLVTEEAQHFAPERQFKGDSMDKVRIFMGVATGGRKFGLNAVYCTQRPALVNKSVLANCNVRMFLRTSEVLDWDVIRRYVPASLNVTYDDIKRFESGEAIVLSRWHEDQRVKLNVPVVAPTNLIPALLK